MHRRFITIAIVLTTVLGALPVALLWFITPTEMVFTGVSPFSWDDFPAYFSAIQQAIDGRWLLFNMLTPEPHAGIFNPLWVGIGLSARLFHLEPWMAFHFARVLLTPLLLLVLWWVVRVLLPSNAHRVGWVFVVFGSGVGYLLEVIFRFVDTRSLDLWVPEAYVWMSILQSPHFVAAQLGFALTLGVWFFALHRVTERRYLFVAMSGIVATVLFSFHPFHAVSLGGIILVHSVVYAVMHKQETGRAIRFAGLWLLCAAPGFAYQAIAQLSDPVHMQRAAQLVMQMPAAGAYFYGYGAMVLLALPGVYALWRSGKRDVAAFLLTWCVVQSVAVYSPIPFSRRLTTGLFIGLGLLAAVGWVECMQLLKVNLRQAFVWSGASVLVLFATTFFSSVCVWLVMANAFRVLPTELYIPRTAVAAFEWIDEHAGTDDVVLAHGQWGVFVPVYARRVTYNAHWGETNHFPKKEAEVQLIFSSGDVQAQAVQEQIVATGADWVFVAADESIVEVPVLEHAYSQEEFDVYRVH